MPPAQGTRQPPDHGAGGDAGRRTGERLGKKTQDRATRILHLLLQKGKLSVDDLAVEVETSAASVRRDLTKLEQRGLVNRTHGAVELAGKMTYEPFRFDAAFPQREERFADEKRRIALAAAALVEEGQTIALAPGTTTTQVARSLRHRSGIHIVTSAVNIGMELSSLPSLQVTLTGGSVRWPGAFSMVGKTAYESLERLFFDIVFLGVCGVHVEHGVTVIEPDEAFILRAMVLHARRVVVVADSSKLGAFSAAGVCRTNEIHTIVTDEAIDPVTAQAMRELGVELLIV